MKTVKKLSALIAIPVLMLTLSGCAPQLSTAETCSQLKSLSAQYGSGGDAQIKEVAGKFDDLAAKAADSVKSQVRDMADYMRARVDNEKDTGKLSSLEKKFSSASGVISTTCNFGS